MNSHSCNFNFDLFLCCRIAIFSVTVLKDDRIVVVAEQRPQCTEEEVGLKWQLFSLSILQM